MLAGLILLCITLLIVPKNRFQSPVKAVNSFAFEDGDLLFIKGTTWRSYFVSLFDNSNNSYSHVGLVRNVNGIPHVIHASPGNYGTGNRGSVLMESLVEFLNDDQISAAALYRIFPPTDKGNVSDSAAFHAMDYVIRGIPFDHEFDLKTDDRVYCTELIIRSYQKAGLELLNEIDKEDVILPTRISRSDYLMEVVRL